MTVRKPMAGTNATDSTEEIRADIEETRSDLGDTVEALAAKTDVKQRAKEAAESAKVQVSEKAHLVQERASELAQRSPERVRQMARRMGAQVRQRPVPFAVAAGALVVLVLAVRRRMTR